MLARRPRRSRTSRPRRLENPGPAPRTVNEDEGCGFCPGRGPLRLEAEQGADAVDRCEILDVLHDPDGSPVDERLVDEQIESVLPLVERGAVERALPRGRCETTAGGAAPRGPVRPVLNQEKLHPSVGGSFERLLPPR